MTVVSINAYEFMLVCTCVPAHLVTSRRHLDVIAVISVMMVTVISRHDERAGPATSGSGSESEFPGGSAEKIEPPASGMREE